MNQTVASHSLRAKLVRLTLGAVLFALVMTAAVVAVYEVTTFRPRALDQARVQAELVAGIVVPALEFDDTVTAVKLLEVLRHEGTVESAAVYQSDGRLMAEFRRAGSGVIIPASATGFAATGGSSLDANRITVVTAVNPEEGARLGWVWLQARLPGWGFRVRQYAPVLVLVALVVTVLSLVIAFATRRQITDPIQSLVETVRRNSISHDLAVRLPETEAGEVGALARSFNAMLAAIGQRDALLQAREARLLRHNAGLAQLNRTDLVDESGYQTALQNITELAAD